MSEERIITAATVTSGEKHDGKERKSLVEKSKKAGMEIDTIIGDGAYSEKSNIEINEPIKCQGEYLVKLKLDNNLEGKIKIII